MPNHYSSKVRVKGLKTHIDQFLKFVKGDAQDFSLQSVIPMPKDLDVREDSSSQNGYTLLYGTEEEQAELLNRWWIKEAGVTTIEEAKKLFEEEGHVDYDGARRRKSNIDNYGYPSWYDWRIDHWGTKWDVYEVDVVRMSRTEVFITFDSAWAPPVPVFQALAEKFPLLSIDVEGRDEFENNWEEVFSHNPMEVANGV